MRGRKPTPTALKKLAGNPGHRPLNEDEPELPTLDTFEVPIELRDDPVAVGEWTRLSALLEEARVLTEGERSSLVALCQQWSRYVEATRKVRDSGMVVLTTNGNPIQNPYLAIANKALQLCTKLWAELGLTPSSRSRLHTVGGGSGANDPFAEFDKPFMDDDDDAEEGVSH